MYQDWRQGEHVIEMHVQGMAGRVSVCGIGPGPLCVGLALPPRHGPPSKPNTGETGWASTSHGERT